MIYICLDTCTWIYLANGIEPSKLLTYLKNEIEEDSLRIILPEIIIDEWNRNKSTAVHNQIRRAIKENKEQLDNLKNLIGRSAIDLFGETDESDEIEDLIEKLQKKLDKNSYLFTEKANTNIKLIEDIFLDARTEKIAITKSTLNTAAQMAINKEAPFKTKNSMADAVIFIEYIKYLKKNKIKGAYFISWNHTDFCHTKGHLFPNLRKLFDKVEGKFFNALGHALHSIDTEAISLKELKFIERYIDEETDNSYLCSECQFDFRFKISNKIIDERERIDPNQLSMFSDVKYSEFIEFDEFEIGECGCGNEHVVCPNCQEILIFDGSYIYNKIQKCESCSLKFYYSSENKKGGLNSLFRILDYDTENCEKCGKEYKGLDVWNTGCCFECENEYNE